MTHAPPEGQEASIPTAEATQQRVTSTTPDRSERDTESEQTNLGLRLRDQVALAVIAGLCLTLLGIYYWRLNSRGIETIALDRPPDRVLEFQVDINNSTWVEWMQLEGIGETLARRIIEDREQNGPFTSVQDVDRVKGIGKATLERLLPHLKCPDCEIK